MSLVGPNGAFAFPVPSDTLLGGLQITYDEVEESPSLDTTDAVSAMDQQNLALEGYMAQLQVATFSGTLDGSGNLTVPHNLTDCNRRIYAIGAWYTPDGTTAKPLTLTQVDAANIVCTGGTASAPYRIGALLLPNPLGW